MGAVVSFDFPTWIALYPEFTATVNSTQATNYFTIATSVHRNDGGGPITDAIQQLALLNMLTAHIAALFAPPVTGQAATPMVGRLSSGTQGSVSVQFAYSNNVSEQMAWFIQSRYGAIYWTATSPYRTMRYIPNKNCGVVGGSGGFGI